MGLPVETLSSRGQQDCCMYAEDLRILLASQTAEKRCRPQNFDPARQIVEALQVFFHCVYSTNVSSSNGKLPDQLFPLHLGRVEPHFSGQCPCAGIGPHVQPCESIEPVDLR